MPDEADWSRSLAAFGNQYKIASRLSLSKRRLDHKSHTLTATAVGTHDELNQQAGRGHPMLATPGAISVTRPRAVYRSTKMISSAMGRNHKDAVMSHRRRQHMQ
jgi:hypothetical protein